ncbi:MAG: hypothetical protein NXI22_14775 [bacterium]|nr:hypothetical protein [bacterium]
MAIPVQCQCGKKFSAKPELAGKKARCPACKSTLTVPKAEAPKTAAKKQSANAKKTTTSDGQIEVKCQCGARFGAGTHLAGKKVACPKCKSPIQIPDGKKVEKKPVSNPAAASKETINVRCKCGARFAAGVHLAGKRVACPKCKQPIAVEVGIKSVPEPAPEPTLIPVEPEPEIAAPEPFALGVVETADLSHSPAPAAPDTGFDDIFASADEFAASAPAFAPVALPAAAPASVFRPTKTGRSGPQWSFGTWMIIAVVIFSIIPYFLGGMAIVAGLISPTLGSIFGMVFGLYIVLYIALVVIGSIVCMFMVMSELWNDGQEMVVVLCFLLGLAPCTFVCGWLYGADRTVMIIWSVLMGPFLIICVLSLCLQTMAKSAGF